MRLVVDIEANGLLDTITEVHCIVCHDGDTYHKFPPDQLQAALWIMQESDTLVFHNGFGYDLPALKKVLGWEYNGRVIDTMILSQITRQERPGGHSLDAWGETLGYTKVQHEDWSVYSPEMMHRCTTDVEITMKVLEYFENKLGGQIRGTRYQYDLKDISM